MTQKHKPGCEGLEQHQPQNPTATSLATARTAPLAQAGGGQEAAESLASGAPPSNTAPDNCNDYFKALRWGVDSLYLSYPGELSREVDAQLKALKQLAQSNDPAKWPKLNCAVGGHIFEVKEKGASLFPYILEDGAFRIQLSRPGHKAPMAYVKVSAKYLAHVGPVEAEKHLYALLFRAWTKSRNQPTSAGSTCLSISQSSVDMESWDRHAWVTRASVDQRLCRVRSLLRLVDWPGWDHLGQACTTSSWKSFVSGKEWIVPLWQKAGWDGQGLSLASGVRNQAGSPDPERPVQALPGA